MGQMTEVRKANAFQTKVGEPAARAVRAATTAGDEGLTRVGVKTKTGAYTLGGVLGVAGGNVAARTRAQRAREKREAVGKAATPTGAGRLTALALKTKNPKVQDRAFGALERNLQSQSKARQAVGKADRDQNSSIGTTVTLARPKGDHVKRSVTAQTRTGSFAGKTRGVGRHLTRDQNSSPGAARVRTPTLRDINGKFAGQGQGVKVFHPTFGGNRRQPRGSQLQHWTKGGDSISKPWVSKTDEVRKGMLGPVSLSAMAPHTGARRGVRIPQS